MCVPIGVKFACGDEWRGWIPCNQPACNIRTYRRDGLPPTADLGDIAAGGNPDWVEARRYHAWAREELAFLKFKSCCCPQCCQRLMDGEKQNGNAAYTKAVKDDLDHCMPVFRVGLTMLNCMRNVPTVFKPPVVDESLLTSLTPKAFAQNLAALRRDQAAGNNTGIDYDQPFLQRNAFTQYLHLRNDVFQHPYRVLNYRWKPPQRLTDLWLNQQIQFGPNVVNDGQVGFDTPDFHSGTQLLREAYIQANLKPAALAPAPFAPVYHNQANLGALAPPPFPPPLAPPPAFPPPAFPPPAFPPSAFPPPAFAPPPFPPPKKKRRANEPTDLTDVDDDTETQGPQRRLGRDITSEGLLDASLSLYAASGANDPDSQTAKRGSGKRKQGARRNYPPPASKSFLERDEWPASFTQDKARKAYEKILATVQQLPEVPISTPASSIQQQQESQKVASGNLKVLKSAGFDMTQIQQRETDTQGTDAAETAKVWRAAMQAMKERRGQAQTYMRQSEPPTEAYPTQTTSFGPNQGIEPVPAYPPVPASAFGGHTQQTPGEDGGSFSEQDLYQDDDYALPAEYDPVSGFSDPDPYGGGGNLLRVQPSTGGLRRAHNSGDRITDRQFRDNTPRDQSSDANSRSSGNNSKGSERGEKGDKRGGKSVTRTEQQDKRSFRARMNDSDLPDFDKLTLKDRRKKGSSHGHRE